ncbi:MAG: lysozyme inhibitor LprI family protein [Pseudomonadota bacterium]
MTRSTLAIFTLLAAVTLPALAEDDGYTAAYAPCMDAAVSTQDIVECTDEETLKQDGRLNRGYKAALQGFSDEQQPRLRDAQRLWVKYRDANCELYANLTGGTIDLINSASCVLDMTKTRAAELEQLAE